MCAHVYHGSGGTYVVGVAHVDLLLERGGDEHVAVELERDLALALEALGGAGETKDAAGDGVVLAEGGNV